MNANPVRQSLFGLLLVLPLLAFVGAPAQAQPAPAGCGGHDGIEFICGLRNIEDMDQVPGRPVLIAASYGTVPAGAPRLLAINTDTRAITPLAITAPSKPDAIYAACPAPLDMTKFSPHGIAIRGGKDGQHILYVVNHGGRESIEIFAVDARSAELKARWLGCVVLPEGASGNAVAPLEDGGFVATKFYDTRDGEQRPQFLARKKNSVIYRWSPKTGLVIVPGGEMVGDNGVLVSPDGQWLYVTSGSRSASSACPSQVMEKSPARRSISCRTICAGRPTARSSPPARRPALNC